MKSSFSMRNSANKAFHELPFLTAALLTLTYVYYSVQLVLCTVL